MAENSGAIPARKPAAGRRVPWRSRTRALGVGAIALIALILLSAFGEAFLTLPHFGFVSVGQGSLLCKLPEHFPPGTTVPPDGTAGKLHLGRAWPLAPRYFVGTDPIPGNVGASPQPWYRSARLWWSPDLHGFPAFTRLPLWVPALAMGVGCLLLRVRDIRRWRRLSCCPHCGYSLAGLEEFQGTNTPCPECGRPVPALAR